MEEPTIEPFVYTGNTVVMDNPISETWCTFPVGLLNRLSDEKKKEMFQRIQAVIDEYAKEGK